MLRATRTRSFRSWRARSKCWLRSTIPADLEEASAINPRELRISIAIGASTLMHINFNKVPLKADPAADRGSTNKNLEPTRNKTISKDSLKAMKETDATKEHANLKFNFDQAISKPQKQAREPQKTITNSGLKAIARLTQTN